MFKILNLAYFSSFNLVCFNCDLDSKKWESLSSSFYAVNESYYGELSNFNNMIYFALVALIFLFFTGVYGLLINRGNFLYSMLALEIVSISIYTLFVLGSFFFNSPLGIIYALCILTTAATESCIGLGLLVKSTRLGYKKGLKDFKSFRG
jgi:NADH-quinone oxidoreductase subunit K